MKAFVVLAALAAVGQAGPAVQGVSSSLVHAALRAKWSSFKAQHGKEYAHEQEEATKMQNFLEATRIIEEHNARFHQGLESFEMGHNQHSDLTLDEIKSTRMGLKMPSNAAELMANASLHVPSSGYQHPASLDWRTWGGVQAVKDQGSCGSCYAFSAMGALETAVWRKNKFLPNLSEQHVVDCTRESGYNNGGCEGGWMHTAFQWIKDKQGSVSQANYPYTARVGTCQHASKPKAAYVQSYSRINNEQALLDAVATTGSVSIAYNAGTQQHSYYRSGVLDIPNCGNTPTHAVLLVGYGNENGKDFWLLKNSWGTGWGEQGYFKLKRGGNQCGIADWASIPVST